MKITERLLLNEFKEKNMVYSPLSIHVVPYEQGQDEKRCFSMYVFLPNARDGLPALVERACTESGFIDKYIPEDIVDLDSFLLPKFKISSELDCHTVPRTLGLELPFVDGGLTEMAEAGDEKLSIDKILQKSCIEVNEDGTEAAAVTYGGVLATYAAGCKAPPITFVADHPFLFLIKK